MAHLALGCQGATAPIRASRAQLTPWPPAGRPWAGRRTGSVRVLPAVVLEDEADRREQDEKHPDQEEPPSDRHTERRHRRRHAGDQRPPAVRAEEAELAGALGDLTGRVVLRPARQPAPGEQEVEAGEKGEAHGQGQRRGPGRVLGKRQVKTAITAKNAAQPTNSHPSTFMRYLCPAGSWAS